MMKINRLYIRLFAFVGSMFAIYAVAFVLYQYHREKAYKADIVNSRLQTYNYQLYEALQGERLLNDSLFAAYVAAHPLDRNRVTIIAMDGSVLMDSEDKHAARMENHARRKEVAEAILHGSGYDIQRVSESTNEVYFYSATHIGNVVVRTAVPYSVELNQSLKADNRFICFSLAVCTLLVVVLFFYMRLVGRYVDEVIADYKKQVRNAEEDKTRIKQQLTQNTAHELKTPTASIQGYIETILAHPDLPAEQRQLFLERSLAQSRRMAALLNDMATLTNLDQWQTVPRPMEKVDVAEVVHAVLNDMQMILQSKGFGVQVALPKTLILNGDRELLYSIFRNILDNAVAYSEGDAITIDCKVLPTKHKATFLVADNGVGVPAEHLPHIFERFYRIDKSRSRSLGGTGLGLAIVKNAIALHGGTCSASRSKRGGLAISFSLPIP